MPRFVILEHADSSGLHWDFMLEVGAVLKTWALAQPPGSVRTVAAAALPDHRPAYLEYQGPISGDRGSVTRWDHGTYRLEEESEGEFKLALAGEKLIGRATISQSPDRPGQWQFSFAEE